MVRGGQYRRGLCAAPGLRLAAPGWSLAGSAAGDSQGEAPPGIEWHRQAAGALPSPPPRLSPCCSPGLSRTSHPAFRPRPHPAQSRQTWTPRASWRLRSQDLSTMQCETAAAAATSSPPPPTSRPAATPGWRRRRRHRSQPARLVRRPGPPPPLLSSGEQGCRRRRRESCLPPPAAAPIPLRTHVLHCTLAFPTILQTTSQSPHPHSCPLGRV